MKRLPQPQPLKAGEAYIFSDGKLYRVGLLNACRARLDPLWRRRRAIVSVDAAVKIPFCAVLKRALFGHGQEE